MSHRIRIQDPDVVFHVTNRTQEAKFLFVPDEAFNAIVMRLLRQAVRSHGIELYAAVVMGNHFHLILRAPRMNLGRFMQHFQGRLARAVNKLRKRCDAAVFPRRYSAEPILDAESFDDMLSYVLLNPVAANLVERPGEYPGYTSFHQHVGAPQPKEHTEEPPPITPPPHWKSREPAEIAASWEALLEPGIAEYTRNRRRPVVGAARLRTQRWWKRPRRPKRSARRPRCHARDKQTWKRWVGLANRIQTSYQGAALAWRRGEAKPFPHGTTPPGWCDCECQSRRRIPLEFRLAA